MTLAVTMLNKMTVNQAKERDIARLAGTMNAANTVTTEVDRWFANRLIDCRNRRKAAILRATQAIRQYDSGEGALTACR